MLQYAGIHNTCNLHDMLDSKVLKTHFRKKNMYMPSTWHELLYTCHILVYPVMHQPDFESIFSYLFGSLGCLDLIGGTSQTHCSASSSSITAAIRRYSHSPRCASASASSGHQQVAQERTEHRQLTATSAPSMLSESR